MADERGYTIGELAQEAGVTTRTIRYYMAEGLLPQPDTRGRYARYTPLHLERLAQIARLKAQYLPLHVIRERLAGAAAPEPAPHPPGTAPSPLSLRRVTAAEHPLRANAAGDEAVMSASAPTTSVEPLQRGHYQFFPDLPEPPAPAEGELPGAPERWQRVVLAPGVELHVREPLSPERRRRLEALIAAARDQLNLEGP